MSDFEQMLNEAMKTTGPKRTAARLGRLFQDTTKEASASMRSLFLIIADAAAKTNKFTITKQLSATGDLIGKNQSFSFTGEFTVGSDEKPANVHLIGSIVKEWHKKKFTMSSSHDMLLNITLKQKNNIVTAEFTAEFV